MVIRYQWPRNQVADDSFASYEATEEREGGVGEDHAPLRSHFVRSLIPKRVLDEPEIIPRIRILTFLGELGISAGTRCGSNDSTRLFE